MNIRFFMASMINCFYFVLVITFTSGAAPSEVKSDTGTAVKQRAKTEVKSSITGKEQVPPQLSDIPSITSPDRTPHACVDCHQKVPNTNLDFRLTTVIAGWVKGTDPIFFKKGVAAAPAGVKLVGKHPEIAALVTVIPNDCLMCHSRDSWKAPPFTKLLHGIHLSGGAENHFLSKVKGTCTSCHKLNQETGAWHLGSGQEK